MVKKKESPEHDKEQDQQRVAWLCRMVDAGVEQAELIESGSGKNFANSVVPKLMDFRESVIARERASDKQIEAVKNMVSGLFKWTGSEFEAEDYHHE